MNRKIIIGGSVGAVVLLVLTMFPTVVCAQTLESTIAGRTHTIQQIEEMIAEEDRVLDRINDWIFSILNIWGSGGFIEAIIIIIIVFLYSLKYI